MRRRKPFSVYIWSILPALIFPTVTHQSTTMSSSDLVDELGILLQALQLPIALQSPADLTPSLLLAVLESILSYRLPLPPELRTALSSRSQHSKNAEIQCMKIFLGVIETDILKRDVGLNRIDPRKLANGNWDEVVYVGEMLCWIGRECGLVDETRATRELQAWRLTPSTAPETSTSLRSSSSPTTADTSTSLHDFDHLRSFQAPSTSSLSPLSPLITSPRIPQCIHEIASPFAQDHIGPSEPSVRYSGYIQPVDEDFEISSFEHNRTLSNCSLRTDKSPVPNEVCSKCFRGFHVLTNGFSRT